MVSTHQTEHYHWNLPAGEKTKPTNLLILAIEVFCVDLLNHVSDIAAKLHEKYKQFLILMLLR